MDDEIEDIVGVVEYTDSQKSVATTNVYSQDFTDSSSSDKNNSSGKETYVIEYDSEDSDSELEKKPSAFNMDVKLPVNVNENDHKLMNEAPVNIKRSIGINSKDKLSNVHVQCESGMSRSTSTSLHRCSFVSQETYTQTSKTVLELARLDSAVQSADYKAMETQTSYVSIIKNKTVEYRFELDSHSHFSRSEHSKCSKDGIKDESLQNDDMQLTNLAEISCLRLFPSNRDNNFSSEISTAGNSTDMLKIIDEEIKDIEEPDFFDNTSEYEDTSKFDSECEMESIQEERYSEVRFVQQDNMSETSVPISVDNDVEELYSNLKKSLDLRNLDRPADFEISRYISLSPLTEESTVVKRESIVDITPNNLGTTDTERDTSADGTFRSKSGAQAKGEPTEDERKPFKLPPIHNQSCPSSLQLNSLFGISPNKLGKASTLPSLFDGSSVPDRWEIGTKDLASGESAHISEISDSGQKSKEPCYLPSIYIEGHINYGDSNTVDSSRNAKSSVVSDPPRETISIQEKIKDLKMGKCRKPRTGSSKYGSVSPKSRSVSPGSASPDEATCEVAERGCEVLCQALIKRLQSQIWFEVVEVLDELPNVLEKFWFVIPEQRIADLIRQVGSHVDSPRTQVARAACSALAVVLKNTNYTKKPDFFEAVTALLVKTGSYSKPVRRAANVALDDVVTGVEPGHAVTALCVHGVSHKSPLVRCAAARLLVVAAALAGGGRGLLRARPASAAHARRLALRALSALLDDKNTDARKYAERLYSMLRPQPNFEAYYLTDVEVETASKQMKKYDQVCGPSKESR